MAKRIKVGSALSAHITVAGIVDGESVNPVYLVWDQRDWCPKACKVFDSTKNAQHEATLLQRFDHPNLARCFGSESPGLMLMEFLEGPTLSGFISSKPTGKLSVSDAMRVAIYIGSALNHMHRRGYLHLDVKASNIIISRDRPVLIDVGTARKIHAPNPASVIGTDNYMSPEQCTMGKLTASSDVYALGVLLFRMLTGKFPLPETRGKNFAQLKYTPTPLRRLRPRASLKLERIITACLERTPNARPPLHVLLPALHDCISAGPMMWPAYMVEIE